MITQIGSLPYNNAKKAIAYSRRHNIPFLPELPRLGDSMLDYIKNPGSLSCLSEFKKYSYDIAKVQCIGPATLMLSGYEEGDAINQIYMHINDILSGLNAERTILFLDEPSLGSAGFNYERMWSDLFSCFKTEKGVHTCGNMDWDILFKADIDIISFDASQYDLTFFSHYKRFRAKKGKIAWGISKLEDIKDFMEGDLITAPCGLGGMNKETGKPYTEEECENALEMLLKASLLF